MTEKAEKEGLIFIGGSLHGSTRTVDASSNYYIADIPILAINMNVDKNDPITAVQHKRETYIKKLIVDTTVTNRYLSATYFMCFRELSSQDILEKVVVAPIAYEKMNAYKKIFNDDKNEHIFVKNLIKEEVDKAPRSSSDITLKFIFVDDIMKRLDRWAQAKERAENQLDAQRLHRNMRHDR